MSNGEYGIYSSRWHFGPVIGIPGCNVCRCGKFTGCQTRVMGRFLLWVLHRPGADWHTLRESYAVHVFRCGCGEI